jgi:hypothetical protein
VTWAVMAAPRAHVNRYRRMRLCSMLRPRALKRTLAGGRRDHVMLSDLLFALEKGI